MFLVVCLSCSLVGRGEGLVYLWVCIVLGISFVGGIVGLLGYFGCL